MERPWRKLGPLSFRVCRASPSAPAADVAASGPGTAFKIWADIGLQSHARLDLCAGRYSFIRSNGSISFACENKNMQPQLSQRSTMARHLLTVDGVRKGRSRGQP